MMLVYDDASMNLLVYVRCTCIMRQAPNPHRNPPGTQACLEAEGLTGAVTVKANPSWQCVHCKMEFPLVQLTELQVRFRDRSSRTTYLHAEDGRATTWYVDDHCSTRLMQAWWYARWSAGS
jgi:hypothetical protein